MKSRTAKLTREEARSKLEAFTEELKAGWEREGLGERLDWAPDLLAMLFEFNREVSREKPDWEQLELLRKGLWDFFASRSGRKSLKGISFILEYADTICQRDSE